MRALVALTLIANSLAVAACNTVRGLGEDLQSVANEVDEET